MVRDLVGEDQTAVGIVAYNDDDAVRISDCVANEPVSRLAPVNVLLELLQISETRVPTDVRVLLALVQTELDRVVVEIIVAPTIKLLSTLTKSPVATLPHFICAGHTPSGAELGTE